MADLENVFNQLVPAEGRKADSPVVFTTATGRFGTLRDVFVLRLEVRASPVFVG